MRKRLALLGIIATLASIFCALAAQPAHAAVALCNNNSPIGAEIYDITPSGSFTRNIYAKNCVEWDDNGVRNNTKISCYTNGGSPCDIRAEVLTARLDRYTPGSGAFSGTMIEDYFPASGSGYSHEWQWQGNERTGSGAWPCGPWFQANDFNIRVRFGFDGVLRNVGNAYSVKGAVC